MAKLQATYPVVIRQLPISSFGSAERLLHFVDACMDKKRHIESLDNNQERKIDDVVKNILCPLPPNLVCSRESADELEEVHLPQSASESDEYCDAVVVFRSKEDADLFTQMCKIERKLFRVDVIQQGVFSKVEAYLLPQFAKIFKDDSDFARLIQTKSGVAIQFTGDAAHFVGQEWQVDIARYYIQRIIDVVQNNEECQTEAERVKNLKEKKNIVQNGTFVTSIRQDKTTKTPRDGTSTDKNIGNTERSTEQKPEKDPDTPVTIGPLTSPIEEMEETPRSSDKERTADEGQMTQDRDIHSDFSTFEYIQDTSLKRMPSQDQSGEYDTLVMKNEKESTEWEKGMSILSDEISQTEKPTPAPNETNIQQLQSVTMSNIRFEFWHFMKTKEMRFNEQLNCIKRDFEIDLVEKQDVGIVEITGFSKKNLNTAEKRIKDLYEGFEFNLEEHTLPEREMNIEILANVNPKLAFRQDKQGRTSVVGDQRDISEFIARCTKELELYDLERKTTSSKNAPIEKQTNVPRQTPSKSVDDGKNSQPREIFEKNVTISKPVYNYLREFKTSCLKTLREESDVDVKETDDGDVHNLHLSSHLSRSLERFESKLQELITVVSVQSLHFENKMISDYFCDVVKQSLQCVVIRDEEPTTIQIACQKNGIETVRDVLTHATSKFVERSEQTFAQKNETFSPKGFLLFDRVEFLLHVCDITELCVDAIVSPAGTHLQHRGGVGKAISAKAGPSYEKECDKYKKTTQSLSVSDVVSTNGGSLPVKKIIHAVVPIWNHYPQERQLECVRLLQTTFRNIFEKAKSEKFTSLALPPIGSGMGMIPAQHVAWTLCEALTEAMCCENLTLETVHFVNISAEILKLVCEEMCKRLTQGEMLGHFVELDSPRVDKSLSKALCLPPRGFNVFESVCIYIYEGDVSKCKVNAVVCPTESSLSKPRGLASRFVKWVDSLILKEFESLQPEEGTLTSCRANSQMFCSIVFRAVLPSNLGKSKTNQEHEMNVLQMLCADIITKAQVLGIQSIAIPLLATDSSASPVATISKLLSDSMIGLLGKKSQLKEIHIVDTDQAFLTTIVRQIASSRFSKSIPQDVVRVIVGDSIV